MSTIPNLLTIAGSDPSGGAGIAADLKTFGALGCYGMAAITALTAQNTRGVSGIVGVEPAFIAAQIDAVFADIRVDAVKIGMTYTPDAIEAIAACLSEKPALPIVLDPVLAATSGDTLGEHGVVPALLRHLLPVATLITPNLTEAAMLTGRPVATTPAEMEAAGRALLTQGARAVLVKGGHLDGADAIDVLCLPDGVEHFAAPRLATRNTHGTGCTLSAAIAAFLARGMPIAPAIADAKRYLGGALAGADALSVGQGHGPLHHFHSLRRG